MYFNAMFNITKIKRSNKSPKSYFSISLLIGFPTKDTVSLSLVFISLTFLILSNERQLLSALHNTRTKVETANGGPINAIKAGRNSVY